MMTYLTIVLWLAFRLSPFQLLNRFLVDRFYGTHKPTAVVVVIHFNDGLGGIRRLVSQRRC